MLLVGLLLFASSFCWLDGGLVADGKRARLSTLGARPSISSIFGPSNGRPRGGVSG